VRWSARKPVRVVQAIYLIVGLVEGLLLIRFFLRALAANAEAGHIEGLVHDPISHRVRPLITSYGMTRRRVAVPMEWVVNRSPTRLKLSVGERSLDDLQDWAQA